jgi:threonine dehydratase
MKRLFADIEAARRRTRRDTVTTPLLELPPRGEGRAFVKLESLQRTGSFKFRGAINRVRLLTEQERRNGVVAYSSGNHGLAVAEAARSLGVSAVIVVPADAPAMKLDGIRAAGARLVTYDRRSEDRVAIAADIVEKERRALIEPFDHVQTIVGQGVAGIEIAEQAHQLGVKPDRLYCCCGGGGLIAGVGSALQHHYPKLEVIGVEPESQADTARSLKLGAPTPAETNGPTLCDSLMSPQPGEITFAINAALLRRVALVSDAAVLTAMRFAFSRLKAVIEPGGAAALAAYLTEAPQDGTTIIVASGGNVDAALFARAIETADEVRS